MVLHTFPRPVLHLLQLLIMSPPMQRSGIKTVAATPAKQKDLERNCIPLRLHPGLAKFVAALAKLRFRAFPSKCYTKYLVESQTCSHVATKTLSIADGTCGTFVNNIFSTIFLEFQSFGNRRWAILNSQTMAKSDLRQLPYWPWPSPWPC